MQTLFWLRFLRGTVRFSASGGFCERFINLCRVRGIRVWDLQVQDRRLSGCVYRRDYRRLRPIARTAGMVLHAEEKRGAVFFMRRNRKRAALPIAGGCFLLLLLLLSNCVWSIDAVGTEGISAETLLSVMEDAGLYVGVPRRKIDASALAQYAMNKLNGKLSWVAVNLDAGRAVIEARDYIAPKDDETFGDPCNVVADFDGLLLSLEVHSGARANREGNGVKKGDLLISGIIENRFGESFFYEARGVVTALHTDTVQLKRPLQCTVRPYRTHRRRVSLRCLRLLIPLGALRAKENSRRFSLERLLTLNGVPLPLSLIETTRAELGAPVSAAPDVSSALLFDDFTAACYEKYRNTNVLESALTVRQAGKERTVRMKSRCIDFMGVQKPIRRAEITAGDS